MAFSLSLVSSNVSVPQCSLLNATKSVCSTGSSTNRKNHQELQVSTRSFFGSMKQTKPCMVSSHAFRPSSSLGTLTAVAEAALDVGQRVRVSESVIVYHNPDKRNDACDVKGMEGTVVKVFDGLISANLPIQVDFGKKFKAHFREEELEKIE
mmetsp:Transcript_0/g.1  ORF Transcript_0/g.1 Transcript_0/m.1 type:complete len:152 (-) Transcript_0:253-708(-)